MERSKNEISKRRQSEEELKHYQTRLVEIVDDRTSGLYQSNQELRSEAAIRQQAEQMLRQSEERFRALVEVSSDWIWEVDKDDRYVYVSPVVKHLLGKASPSASPCRINNSAVPSFFLSLLFKSINAKSQRTTSN
ncbi:MAG: PAS domain S-box protein [Proteobacteria bacterium]|nr:PAS domain S-box protein [Pseudomonadota bacterium]